MEAPAATSHAGGVAELMRQVQQDDSSTDDPVFAAGIEVSTMG